MAPGSNTEAIDVTVIGGYLGAGKTTLVNHVLRNGDERIVVLVNDFGAVDIDADLITSADDDTITLANGCICCSLVDGFSTALESVRSLDLQPDRLVIEASGVADPAQVAAWAHQPGFRLDGVVTVIDSEQVRRQADDRYVGDMVRQQIGAADLLIGNKMDLADSNRDDVLAWIGGITATAPVVPAVRAEVPLDVVLGVERREHSGLRPPIGSSPTPSADELFTSWALETDEPVDRVRLEQLLDELPRAVVRAKGTVQLSDTPSFRTVVHRVGQRNVITTEGPWPGGPSRVAIIAVTGGLPANWQPERLA